MKINFLNINKIVSITINILDKDSYEISGLLLKFVKNEIEIISEFKKVNSIEKFILQSGMKNPFILHFTGKGIINKKEVAGQFVHQSIILNAKIENFYFTDYIQGTHVFSSVIRKSIVHEFVENIEKHKINIIQIGSGPFLLSYIQSYIPESEFVTSNYLISFKNEEIIDFSKLKKESNFKYQIGNNSVSSDSIIALSNGSIFFSKTANKNIDLSDYSSLVNKGEEEAKQKKIFSSFSMFLMVFFLVILLGNYLYLGKLNSQFRDNSNILMEFVDEFEQIKILEEEKTRKETLLRTSGILSKKYISFYLVELTNSVPKGIEFSQFKVKPLKYEIKSRKKIEIDNQLILIKGTAKTSSKLSDWIDDLKSIEWIKKIDIIDYDFAKGLGVFNIKIVI